MSEPPILEYGRPHRQPPKLKGLLIYLPSVLAIVVASLFTEGGREIVFKMTARQSVVALGVSWAILSSVIRIILWRAKK
jgi:hypothetical protein